MIPEHAYEHRFDRLDLSACGYPELAFRPKRNKRGPPDAELLGSRRFLVARPCCALLGMTRSGSVPGDVNQPLPRQMKARHEAIGLVCRLFSV